MALEPGYWTEHWRYSRWVLLTAFVFQLSTQGYYWLAVKFLSVGEVGSLRSMVNIVIPLDQVFTAMDLVILPAMCSRYASKRFVGLVPLWKRYCGGWFVITCAFAAVVVIWGKPVMHLLYAGKFDSVAPLVRILALLPVVTGAGHTINSALKAAERPNLVFYAYVFSGAATFVFGIPLVIHLGLRGAVLGMLVSATAYTVALALGFCVILRMGQRTLVTERGIFNS